jgi:hypothetical protein
VKVLICPVYVAFYLCGIGNSNKFHQSGRNFITDLPVVAMVSTHVRLWISCNVISGRNYDRGCVNNDVSTE